MLNISTSSVYGIYEFTKFYKTISRFLVLEPIIDPRNRPHNAKGGFLDRIVFTSGLPVESKSFEYGAVIDPKKFEQKKILLYAQSDHLPVIRYFTVSSPKGTSKAEDDQILQRYKPAMILHFLCKLFNKITRCNQDRNAALEQIDNKKATLQWYIPNSLLEYHFHCYNSVVLAGLQ